MSEPVTEATRDARSLPKRPDLISLAVVCAHLGFALLPVYIAARRGLGYDIFVWWLWFGLALHGVINLMHECAHVHVFKRRWASDLLGRWILAPLMFADFDSYRDRHWEHHRSLGGPEDTKEIYRSDIRGWGSLRLVLGGLTGGEIAERLRQLAPASGPARSRGWLLRVAIVQALFLLSLGWAAAAGTERSLAVVVIAVAGAWLFVFGYGAVSLTRIVASFRTIAEHQVCDDGSEVVGWAALRNLSCRNPFSRLLFGCWGFADHATHHAQPGVPAYHLPELTRALALERPELTPERGYASVLGRMVWPER